MKRINNSVPVTDTSSKLKRMIGSKLSIESLCDELLYSVVLFAGEKNL